MKRAPYLILLLFACGDETSTPLEPTDGGVNDTSVDAAPTLVELVAAPSSVTLLGPGGGRSIALLGRTSTTSLHLIDDFTTSSDPAVATVSGSRIHAIGTGNTTVIFHAGGLSASVSVVVEQTSTFGGEVLLDQPGAGAGYGRDSFPAVVLGPPNGGGRSAGSLDVLSLGIGGSITLGFGDLMVYDGPGPDLLVFENAFVLIGSGEAFAEPGEVAVSLGGAEFHTYPCDASAYPFPGCAGVEPVIAGSDAEIDATDPRRAGGDKFDLADLGLAQVDRIRVTDPGVGQPTGSSSGFDLDAVGLVHALPVDTDRIEVMGQSSLSIQVGDLLPLPSFAGVRADGTRIDGIPVDLSSNGGCVTIGEGAIRAVQVGTTTLEGRAGPFAAEVSIEVEP